MNELHSLNAEDSFRGLYLLAGSDICQDILAHLYSFFSQNWKLLKIWCFLSRLHWCGDLICWQFDFNPKNNLQKLRFFCPFQPPTDLFSLADPHFFISGHSLLHTCLRLATTAAKGELAGEWMEAFHCLTGPSSFPLLLLSPVHSCLACSSSSPSALAPPLPPPLSPPWGLPTAPESWDFLFAPGWCYLLLSAPPIRSLSSLSGSLISPSQFLAVTWGWEAATSPCKS